MKLTNYEVITEVGAPFSGEVNFLKRGVQEKKVLIFVTREAYAGKYALKRLPPAYQVPPSLAI